MFTVRENDVANNTIVITRRMIDEFRCAESWIGIVRNDRVERLLNRKINSGGGVPCTNAPARPRAAMLSMP